MKFTLNDFDFELPSNLIAQHPLPERSQSKLLCLNKKSGIIKHTSFVHLPDLLLPGDLLIFNDTKVIPARLYAKKSITGGKIEILVERIINDVKVLAQIRSNKTLKQNLDLIITDEINAKIIGKQNDFSIVEFQTSAKYPDVLAILEKHGQTPLPRYIKRASNPLDITRYQTIFATHPGAVAAPTASLHFDEKIMRKIAEKNIATAFVTLHVGAGTFKPIRTNNFINHKMHYERCEVPPATVEQIKMTKQRGGRVIAVGTTAVRCLETAAMADIMKEYHGDTNIFIYPGFKFKCVDALITNFHLPKSTLLLLVSAFSSRDEIMRSYQEAIKLNYRFFSYGDAMFIE